MPRPKRSKVTPTIPTKLQAERVAKPALAPSVAQKKKDLFSPSSSGRITTTSDDSDGLVVAKKTRRSVTSDAQKGYRMSGALAVEDIGDTRSKPPSSKTRAELNRIVREGDHEQAKWKEEMAGLEAQEAATDDPEQIPSAIPAEAHLIGKESSSPGSRESVIRQPTDRRLGSKVQETPRVQTSLLFGSAFKRRQMQPSLLQIAQSQNQTQIDSNDDSDMYDFLPDEESTPLNKSLSQPIAHHVSSSSGRTSSSRKRKRTTPEVQVPASQSQSTQPRSSPTSSPPPSSVQEDVHESPVEEAGPEPQLPRHRSTQTPQPQIFSDTLAPPQSSSQTKQDQAATRKSTKAKNPSSKVRHIKSKALSPAPAPSPLSSQDTQNPHILPVKRNPKAEAKPLTTASLQNLLPKRRPRERPKGEYDMPSSSDVGLDNTGLGEDEDELSLHATKVPKKKPGTRVAKSVAKRKEAAAKKKAKTYSRKSVVLSDNDEANSIENDSVNGDIGGDNNNGVGKRARPALDGKARAEMKRLADKFREVDEYALDFEDMTGNSSSQMKDAR